MGQYVDYYCKNNNKILNSIVDIIILKKFGWLPQKDYDDFYSIAGQVIWDCERRFDDCKGASFETFLIGCLGRKFKTRITYMNREKRNNGIPDLSMEKMIDDESDTTISDMIAVKPVQDIHFLAQRYIDSLPKMQRRVAELIIEGYDNKSIKNILGLSDKRFKMIIQRMRAKEKIEPLEKLKGVRK